MSISLISHYSCYVNSKSARARLLQKRQTNLRCLNLVPVAPFSSTQLPSAQLPDSLTSIPSQKDIRHCLRSLTAATACLLLPADPSIAARLSAPLEEVHYKEVVCSSPKIGFTCVEFSGQLTNNDKKSINTADIYGRIYGARFPFIWSYVYGDSYTSTT